jgi:hypothetical protein
MNALPPVEADYLERSFLEGTEALRGALGLSGEIAEVDPESPAAPVVAMVQLFQVLRRIEHDAASGGALDAAEITELGDYGFSLIEELASRAMQRGLAQDAQVVLGLCVPLALWVVRRGGRLRQIQTVVNALADLANRTRDPALLAELSARMEEIVAGVDAEILEDRDRPDPMRPWRILLLNHGIVATRSHDPERMERAYHTLVSHLPEEAPGFFREGMQQMAALDYPPQVRTVVKRWSDMWGSGATRH